MTTASGQLQRLKAEFFRALAHPIRIRLLEVLVATPERSVHDLRGEHDFWAFHQEWLADLPIADARWGSAAYLPMLDGASYVIYVAPRGGLVAKPADDATERLLDAAGW